MRIDLRKKILAWVLGITIGGAAGYYLWEAIKFETQLRDLQNICGNLKLQSTLDEVQMAIAFSPLVHMVLMDTTPEGEQAGSIYFHGSGRWGCAVSFLRGRLTKRSFGSGQLGEPGAKHDKLKPW